MMVAACKGSFDCGDASLSRSTAFAQDDKGVRCCLAAGGWLGVGFVLLVPDFSFLFDGCGLGARHVGSQDCRKILAALVSASSGQNGPEIGLAKTWRYTAVSCEVTSAQCGLRFHISVFGCFCEPGSGFLVILLHSVPGSVTKAQCVLG